MTDAPAGTAPGTAAPLRPDALGVRLRERGLGLLASGLVPARLLYPPPPPRSERAARTGRLSIEIVSHCWGYSRLLAHQLTSLVDHPVEGADVTVSVFHAAEDAATVRLLEFFGAREVPNVAWRWRTLAPPALFRRAIGRNLAAKGTAADWIWFTDCDLVFGPGCLDSLARALQGRTDALVHPRVEAKTDAYASTGPAPGNALEVPALLRADPGSFVPHAVGRATGPLQIVHGDVARAVGYCDAVAHYRRPVARFAKCTEDRVFRWLLGTDGTAIDVDAVARVQHVDKGRYGGADAGARRRARLLQDRWRRRAGRAP